MTGLSLVKISSVVLHKSSFFYLDNLNQKVKIGNYDFCCPYPLNCGVSVINIPFFLWNWSGNGVNSAWIVWSTSYVTAQDSTHKI